MTIHQVHRTIRTQIQTGQTAIAMTVAAIVKAVTAIAKAVTVQIVVAAKSARSLSLKMMFYFQSAVSLTSWKVTHSFAPAVIYQARTMFTSHYNKYAALVCVKAML
jgi:hypothetical protein